MSRFGRKGMEPATPVSEDLIRRLLDLWANSREPELAIGAMRGISLNGSFGGVSDAGLVDQLRVRLTERPLTLEERGSTAVVAYHVGAPYTKAELADMVNELLEQRQGQVPGIKKLRKLAALLVESEASAGPNVAKG